MAVLNSGEVDYFVSTVLSTGHVCGLEASYQLRHDGQHRWPLGDSFGGLILVTFLIIPSEFCFRNNHSHFIRSINAKPLTYNLVTRTKSMSAVNKKM